MPDSLLLLAEQEGIDVRYANLSYPLNGLYWQESPLPPVIFIAKRIINDTPLFRCVLAEELGHHFTSVGDCLPKQFLSKEERRFISKAEYKAARWAAYYLIPKDALINLTNIYSLWELSEYFNVVESFMEFRLSLA